MELFFKNLLSFKGHSNNNLYFPNVFCIVLAYFSLQSMKSKGRDCHHEPCAHSSQSTVSGTQQILQIFAAALEDDVDPGPRGQHFPECGMWTTALPQILSRKRDDFR